MVGIINELQRAVIIITNYLEAGPEPTGNDLGVKAIRGWQPNMLRHSWLEVRETVRLKQISDRWMTTIRDRHAGTQTHTETSRKGYEIGSYQLVR